MGSGPKRVVSSGSVGIRGLAAPGTALSLLEPHETGLQRVNKKEIWIVDDSEGRF